MAMLDRFYEGLTLDIRAYGATGDGVTDDTAMFNRAITQLSANGGGTLVVPIGTYIIDPSVGITVSSNVNIIGAGNSSVLKIADGKNTTGNLLKVVNADGVSISDLLLEGNRFNQAVTTTKTVASVAPASDTITITAHGFSAGQPLVYKQGTTAIGGLTTNTLYYVIVSDANNIKLATTPYNAIAGTAIDLTSAGTGTHTFAKDDYTSNNYGLYLSTSTNLRVERVTTRNFTGVGNHMYNCAGSTIEHCVSFGNLYHGYECEQNRGSSYIGNHAYRNDRHGMALNPGEVSGTGSVGCSFIGNSIINNGQYGINADAANGDVSAWLSTGNIIEANSIRNNAIRGITIWKNDNFIVRSNYIANNMQMGMYVYQSQNHVINGNIFYNNSAQTNNSADELMLEGFTDNNSHPSKNNIITNNTFIITGTNKARYAINEASSGDGGNVISNNLIPSAGATGTVRAQSAQTSYSPVGTYTLTNAGQAITGAQAGLDTAFNNTMRLYNNFSGGETQVVNPNGAFTAYVGGSKRLDIGTNGYVKIATPASAPTLPDNGTVALYLDEAGNNLKVAVKYSGGTTKTATVALT